MLLFFDYDSVFFLKIFDSLTDVMVCKPLSRFLPLVLIFLVIFLYVPLIRLRCDTLLHTIFILNFRITIVRAARKTLLLLKPNIFLFYWNFTIEL